MCRANNDGWSENDTFDVIKRLFREKKIQMTMHGVIIRSEQLSYTEFAGDIFTPIFTTITSFDIVTFILGAICQQGTHFTYTNDVRSFGCIDHISCYFGFVHNVFGEYRCSPTKPKQFYHESWWFDCIAFESWYAWSRLCTIHGGCQICRCYASLR